MNWSSRLASCSLLQFITDVGSGKTFSQNLEKNDKERKKKKKRISYFACHVHNCHVVALFSMLVNYHFNYLNLPLNYLITFPCLNMCRSKTSEKVFTFYFVNAKLKCCCSTVDQVHHKSKCEKPADEFSFLRSYRVVTCSFTKKKIPSPIFFHGLQ